MTIILCDDQKEELEAIARIVDEYAAGHPELFLQTKCFCNPLDVLQEMDKNGAPDIALLDICMPGLLGTDVAKEILKRSDSGTDIIFLTSSSDFAVEAFSLHANDYLTKPYTRERLTATLASAIEKRRDRLFVPIQCGNEVHRIDLHHVLYVESKNHSVEIHLKSGNCLKTRTPLTELRRAFEPASGFAAIGASYIVNLRYVKSLLPTTLEMAGGEAIPVPRRLRADLKKQYFDFYAGEAVRK